MQFHPLFRIKIEWEAREERQNREHRIEFDMNWMRAVNAFRSICMAVCVRALNTLHS